MGKIMNFVLIAIIMQAFYSFAITTFVYVMPEPTRIQSSEFTGPSNSLDLANMSNQLQDTVERQTTVPIVDVGALVFYSGNILLDFLLNMAFALPELLGLLISGFLYLFAIDNTIVFNIQVFASVAVAAWYLIGALMLITSIRSGTGGIQ